MTYWGMEILSDVVFLGEGGMLGTCDTEGGEGRFYPKHCDIVHSEKNNLSYCTSIHK
jgi:hypothetical protein